MTGLLYSHDLSVVLCEQAHISHIIGSYYEVHCTKNYDFPLHPDSMFTDDTVLTAATCKAILINSAPITKRMLNSRAAEYAEQYRQFFSYYPHAGFGNMFRQWATEGASRRQHSYGNGAAMRAVPIGYAYKELEQVLLQAKASCLYTHDHCEAIAGAQAVAAAVWLARSGESKQHIKSYIESHFGYELSASIDDIRCEYVFDSRTRYSVPPAIIAFLDSNDYESAVRNAISLGGDADTMACIAGGIAEAFYGVIPHHIASFCNIRLDITIKTTARQFLEHFA